MSVYRQTRPMRVIYVAGLYRGETSWEVRTNVERAIQYARWVMYTEPDTIVICPHINTDRLDGARVGHVQILDGYLEMISRGTYDEIRVLPGSSVSQGTQAEIFAAEQAGTAVVHIALEALKRIVEQQMFHRIEDIT